MIEMDGVNLISNVGFPIGAFLLMYFFSYKTLKENTEAIRSLHVLIQTKLK